MIDRLRRLFVKGDPIEDLTSAYVDADDEVERARIEERLREGGADLDEIRSLRDTSRMLRAIETVDAPRSYALTPDMLAERGYSDNEIDRILNPSSGGIGSRLARPTVYVPLAIGALAIIGVVALTIGDITDYATERFDESADVSLESAGSPSEPMAAFEAAPVQTVIVEKEVHVQGETVIQTVIVEKEVVVVETVIVEKEVVVEVEREVVKEVEVERVVEVEREVVVEREVEVAPTPAPVAAAAMAVELETVAEPESMMADSVESPLAKKDADDERQEALEEDPCVVEPTATPTVEGTPSDASSPTATPTVSAIPICTPTPTPTATSTPTLTP